MKKQISPLSSRLIFAPCLIGKIPEPELLESFAKHNKSGELVSKHQAKNGIGFRLTTTKDNRFTIFAPA